MQITCLKCGQIIEADDAALDTTIACPKCGWQRKRPSVAWETNSIKTSFHFGSFLLGFVSCLILIIALCLVSALFPPMKMKVGNWGG
jgi:DNA-directed RNA polymerase subunit RPC12/RpoP